MKKLTLQQPEAEMF